MTDPVVELAPTQVAVEPGGQARVVVTVANEGNVVEGYRVDVLDDLVAAGPGLTGPASWWEVLPAGGGAEVTPGGTDLTVYPGDQQSVVVVFSPPAGTSAPGGRCAFAVRVSSILDPSASAVVEGEMEIGRVTSVQARLVPVTSRGRWQGRHVLEVTNGSNVPVTLQVSAEDPDRALGFLVHPDTLTLPVGASQPVRLRVRTRHPRLRGAAARLPFTVQAIPAGAAPVAPTVPGVPGLPTGAAVDGAFTQKPIVTTGAVVVAGLALVAVAGLAAYGLTRADGGGPLSETRIPPTPQALSVTAAGPESVLVRWDPVEQAEAYQLYQLNGAGDTLGKIEVPEGLDAQVVEGLPPGEEVCFSLTAVRADKESPRSETVCQRTEVAAPEPTDEADPSAEGEETGEPTGAGAPTEGGEGGTGDPGGTGEPTDAGTEDPDGTGDPDGGPGEDPTSAPPTTEAPVFGPGDWAAVLAVSPAQAAADTLAARLVEAGVDAAVVDTQQFPDLGLAPGWLVVQEEAYASRDEAATVCPRLQDEVNRPGEAPLIVFCDRPVQLVRP